MNIIQLLSNKKKHKKLFFIIFFMFFLFPFSFSLNNSGVSANYSFILFPIFIILLKRSIKIPDAYIIMIILLYSLIFLVSIIYQSEYFEYLDRRVFSFFIFMTIFSYVTIKIDHDMIEAFKIAIILIVFCIIFYKINSFIFYTNQEIMNLKAVVGSQRYGFIYLFAFWITVFYQPHLKTLNIIKIACIFLIIVGLILTYSRASIMGLMGSFVFYFFNSIYYNKSRFLILFLSIIVSIVIVITLQLSFPRAFGYFFHGIFSLFTKEGILELINRLNDSGSSEGFRFALVGNILKFLALNPFTGSGFLGCWVMYDNLSCSAHGQFNDVIFRVGIFGFCAYLFLLFRILKYLYSAHRDLFFSLIGALIYGLFHETFKLSQGAFVLTFMIGMMVSSRDNIKISGKSDKTIK